MRRPAMVQDIRNVVRAWHMLAEISATGPCMTAQDVPPPIEPILSTVETMKLTDKITGCPELMLAHQLPYLEELETIMTGRQVRYHTNGCSVNHFTLDERAADSATGARHGRDRRDAGPGRDRAFRAGRRAVVSFMDHTLKHWRESLWLPALGVLAIINFAWNWNNFFEPLIYLNSTERFTVALGLTLFQGRMNREIPGLMAMTLISMIPVLITFYIAQRYFIQGIVISGIKG